MAAPILYHESRSLKVTISSALIFFLQKIIEGLTSLFLPLFAFETAWEFSFSDGGSRDRDIISWLVFCFLGCLVKFQAREANSWRRSASNWVCLLFLYFLLLAFFHNQTHTFKQEETRKGWKETETESSSLHSICGLQINVWFGPFIYSWI